MPRVAGNRHGPELARARHEAARTPDHAFKSPQQARGSVRGVEQRNPYLGHVLTAPARHAGPSLDHAKGLPKEA